jgi:KUP system potassium uptake protein
LAWSAWNPAHAVDLFVRHGSEAWFALGSVVLVITGVEALFADLGHFGAAPVRIGWLTIVFPSLLLNYMGQAAHVLSDAGRADYAEAFYKAMPSGLLWPMILLSTLATVIASQALISGAFSLVSQAMALDLFPHIRIVHTSKREGGQIYIPLVNYGLMVITIALVVEFKSSLAFANAYGVAVTAVIVLTSVMTTIVMVLRVRTSRRRRWWLCGIALYLVVFLFISANFFGANVVKFVDGGWITILIGLIIGMLNLLWRHSHACCCSHRDDDVEDRKKVAQER